MKVTFPELAIPEVKLSAGCLLNVWLLGVNLKIPPIDLTFSSKHVLTPQFTIFDSDWVTNPLTEWMLGIPWWVWDACKTKLDEWAAEYYERHKEE